MLTSKRESTEAKLILGRAAMAVGLVASALTLVLCALLTATHLQLKHADPLNNEMLVSLRQRYEAGEREDRMKSDIRELDLLARKAFFVSQSQIRTGGVLAIISAVVMLLAFGVYQAATRNVPPPPTDKCGGVFWSSIERSRIWIAGGTTLLIAVSIVMTLSTPTSLTPELAKPPAVQPPTNPKPAVNVPVFPDNFSANSPVFRGPANSGQTNFKNVPTEWDETTEENLLWKKSLDLPAWASPVVWGNKVIALGADTEKRIIYCLDADTGEDLWTTTAPEHKDAVKNYEANTQDARWDTLVYAGAAPAINGKQVFTLFSNGQLLALNLADGEVLWNIVPGQTGTNTFGLDSAPLIYRDSVIIVFEGTDKFIARYDAATGKEIWKSKRENSTWSSPILAKRSDDKYLVIVFDDPNVTAWDPESGEKVWSSKVLIASPDFCVGPSPIQVGDRVFVNCQNSGIYALNLSDGKMACSIEELPDEGLFPDGVSMTTDGKHLYQFYQSSLTCIDAETGKVVKQKEMEKSANFASAALNNGNLYLFSDGVTLIVNSDPDSDFAPVGKGSIDESSDSCPAIIEGRIYMRSDESLYCFGTK